MSLTQTVNGGGPVEARWLFTVAEVAARTGWSESLIRRGIVAGRIAVVRLGRTVRISRQEVERLIGGPLPVPGRPGWVSQTDERMARRARDRALLAEQQEDGDWTERLMDASWVEGLMRGKED